jgi:hypothetical protein
MADVSGRGAGAKAGFARECRGAEPRSPPFKGGGGGYSVDTLLELRWPT